MWLVYGNKRKWCDRSCGEREFEIVIGIVGIELRLKCSMINWKLKFIIDKKSMIIRCIWIIVDLSNEIGYKWMIVLIIRKRVVIIMNYEKWKLIQKVRLTWFLDY